MSKKLSNLSDLGEFVFSTNKHLEVEKNDSEKTLLPKEQELQAVFSNKGRAGKTVTIIKGFKGSESDLKALGKTLKTSCGVGGSIKNGEIIIQGNYRDKIIKILEEKDYKVKRVGG